MSPAELSSIKWEQDGEMSPQDTWNLVKKLTKVEFPLFLEHPADPTKYTYGVFLLNKNLEQLLNAHGLRSAGPRHTLQNLRRILNARCVVASAREEEDAHA